MRPNATRRDHWAQLGIGAAALILPPLALGAAFYSMLAPQDDEVTGPAAAQTVVQPPALPAAAGVETNQTVEEVARAWNRLLAEGGSVQTAPAAPSGPIHIGPAEVAPTPAAAVIPPADPAAGGVTPPAADSPPVPPTPPKRTHRQAPRQPQQDPYPVRTWLQQIGILPRNAKDTRG